MVNVYNFLFYLCNNIEAIEHIKDESTPPDNKAPQSLSVYNLFSTHLINLNVNYYYKSIN